MGPIGKEGRIVPTRAEVRRGIGLTGQVTRATEHLGFLTSSESGKRT